MACRGGSFGRTIADYHAYVPGFNEIRKRVQSYGGKPFFRMDHGNLSPVKVLRFGDMPALAAESHYRSWYH
jgi:hypothetical protein